MIRDMKDRGMSNREIARDLGISRNTVSKLLRTTRLADHRKRERRSKLDPYREKIRASGSRFNQKFMDFAEYYGIVIRLCYPYRPETKGKIENTLKCLYEKSSMTFM